METQERFVRRHWLVSPEHIEKVRELSEREHLSASEVVRRALDAYSPGDQREREAEAALEAMSRAIRATRAELAAMRERLDQSLSTEARERDRERVREEVRAHFRDNPEDLDNLAEFLRTGGSGR